jgi:uncharacterized spore protein YtfJ
MEGKRSRPRALRIKTVRGDPYCIAGRELIPEARVVTFGKARGTVGDRKVSGLGGGFVWIKPLAVIEVTPTGERRIPIQAGTAAAMRGMLTVTIAMAFLLTTIRWLVRWKQKSG